MTNKSDLGTLIIVIVVVTVTRPALRLLYRVAR